MPESGGYNGLGTPLASHIITVREAIQIREKTRPRDPAMKFLCDLAVLAIAACVVIFTFMQGLQ